MGAEAVFEELGRDFARMQAEGAIAIGELADVVQLNGAVGIEFVSAVDDVLRPLNTAFAPPKELFNHIAAMPDVAVDAFKQGIARLAHQIGGD